VPQPSAPTLTGPLFPFAQELKEDRFNSKCGKKLMEGTRNAWGYISLSGCVVIEPRFGKAEPFSTDDLAVVGVEKIIEEEERWGVGFNYGAINRQGELVIEPRYLALSDFESGVAIGVLSEQTPDSMFPKKTGYFLSSEGEHLGDANCGMMMRGASLHDCDSLNEGLSFQKSQQTIAQWKELLSEEAMTKVLDDVSGFIGPDSDTPFSSSQTPGQYVDASGTVDIDQWFAHGCPFHEGLACAVSLDKGKVGFIDKQGQTVIPFEYDYANDFVDGLAMVKIGEKTIYIDVKGQEVFSTDMSTWGQFGDGLVSVYEREEGVSRFGFMGRQGKLAIPFQFDRVGTFANGVVAVGAGKKHGEDVWRFVGKDGNPAPGLGEKTFGNESTPLFHDGLALVYDVTLSKEGTHWEWVDEQMVEVDGAVVKKWGYIGLSGEWVYGPVQVDWQALAGTIYSGRALCE
jgi:hypothetical protein